MATATTTTAPPTPKDLAQQILEHRAPTYTFTFSPFLRKTYGHGLAPNRPVCKAFAATGACPLGTDCPDRHEAPNAASSTNASYNSLVCKHWLRALCKKGESCEFLHEYNLRKMPECNFFVRNGYCSNGDECLYLHIDPQSKLPPCPHYDMGFCPLGPNCSKKHVRRALCPYYLAGFCPDGKQCPEGAHPRWSKNLERPVPKSEKAAEDEALRREREEQGFGNDDDGGFRRGDRDDKDEGRGFRGGRGRGGWKPRGRGFGRGRGRGHQ
ncbi:RNA-binding component of cleavage and polyadenylation factor [Pestalotiopsis sp. 9143b]|nr:RNA-binding component of cleavage and polyadenylation factor [Pestalotiopsis sp. 9143b]